MGESEEERRRRARALVQKMRQVFGSGQIAASQQREIAPLAREFWRLVELEEDAALSRRQSERRSISRAIRGALKLISEQDPDLGRLLSRSIKTGQFLSYVPGPGPSVWKLGEPPREATEKPEATREPPAIHRSVRSRRSDT